jgi:hypothetical protein
MGRFLKSVITVVIAWIILSCMFWLGIAFIKAELNPFLWKEELRVTLVFLILCITLFSPIVTQSLYDEVFKN